MSAINFDAELAQYVATALWASIDEQPDGNGGPMMDENYGPDDLAPEALESMRADLQAFIDGADPAALDYWLAELGDGQIGHDFWLTRNHHGAGFWDRFMSDPGAIYGQSLTEQAHPYGESYLYAANGKVYVA